MAASSSSIVLAVYDEIAHLDAAKPEPLFRNDAARAKLLKSRPGWTEPESRWIMQETKLSWGLGFRQSAEKRRGEAAAVAGKVKIALLREVNVDTLMPARLWEEVVAPPQAIRVELLLYSSLSPVRFSPVTYSVF